MLTKCGFSAMLLLFVGHVLVCQPKLATGTSTEGAVRARARAPGLDALLHGRRQAGEGGQGLWTSIQYLVRPGDRWDLTGGGATVWTPHLQGRGRSGKRN